MKTSQELLDAVAACPAACSMWWHYRGGIYRVVGSAVDEASLEPLVLYRECRGGLPSVTFARPLAAWAASVEHEGALVRRFRPFTTETSGGG